MKYIGCESLRFSHDTWIEDGPPRGCHVACVINNPSNARRWILIRRFRCVSLGFNLSLYNSLDQQPRLNHFKTIRQRIKSRQVPRALSEDQRLQFNRTIGRSTFHNVTSRIDRWSQRDRMLQIAPHHLRTYEYPKNKFLSIKIWFLIPKNPEKSIKNSEKF